MSKLLWMFCFGLCCWISTSQPLYVISCRFWGVFQVEKGVRYNQTAEEARKTCDELDAVIATKEQVQFAMESGFEICRYGWIDNNTVAIPRITANPVCAGNYMGLYTFHPNLTALYDVFCYNASDQTEKNCDQYDYRNKSIPSHDPTEEGVYGDSESSKVSPTHPGLDVGSTQNGQMTAVESVTPEPEMSTEQSEHSGDHNVPTEDSDNTNQYYTESGEHGGATDGDELISVDSADEKHVSNREDGSAPATDPSSHWNTGSHNEFPSTPDDHVTKKDNLIEDISSEDDSVRNKSEYPESKQKRRAAIPDWLIVCVSLVCLGLIFSVCIALNARRMCGQKKKLVINGNKGSPEDGVIMEQNGDTVKSQEMVQLVSKEQTGELGDQDEPLTQNDIRNTKDVDMKIGV